MSAVVQDAGLVLAWSEFASIAGDSVWRRSATWAELVERIRAAKGYPTKAACPWVKLATFGNVKTDKNCLRNNDNVVTISGVEGDYDGEVIQPEEGLARLERAGIRCMVYTSPSHKPEKPRWRVLAPCSKAMPPEARAGLLARINGVLGGVLSDESFTLSQSYYFGQVNGVEYRVLVAFDDPDEGTCVDELDELDQIAIGKPGKAPRVDAETGEIVGKPCGEHVFAEAVQALGRKLRTGDGGGRREMLKSFIASRSARGLPASDIRLLIDGIVARYFDPADPIDERNIVEIVRWATGRDDAARQRNADLAARMVAPLAAANEDDADDDDEQPEGGAPTTLMSEDAMALDFAALAASSYRWSPGLAWMVDNGVVWERDDALTRYSLSREVARATARQVLAATGKESDARKIATAKSVNSILALAQSDPRLVVPASVWDADVLVLNTPQGVVDLRTGALRPRGAAEYVTQAARVAPAAGPCPTWLRFLDQVFMGDRDLIEFMRRALGYSITGDRREQVLFFWYGLGANGKSVLIDLMQWLAGDYALKLPASVLMQSKGERHPTELAQLRGKRLAVSSELDETSFFNESLIKELTGDTTLSARFMRQDFFEFAMTQKHVIVGNFKPRLKGGDPAIARRMLLVPFLASFKGSERDPYMLDKLKAEAPGILHWIVGGAAAWARDGLAVPESVRAASADYLADNDDLALWMDECCHRSGEAKASDLYASFAAWKKQRGEHATSLTAWGSRLTSIPGITKRKSNGVRLVGVSLTAAERSRLDGSHF